MVLQKGKCGCFVLINKLLFEVNLPYGQYNFTDNWVVDLIPAMDAKSRSFAALCFPETPANFFKEWNV